MTALLGAWSLDGAPVASHLDDEAWRAMTRHAIGELEELRGSRLWLGNAVGKREREAGDKVVRIDGAPRVVAWEGFVTARPHGIESAPQGHFALVEANGSRLRLLRSLSGGERLYFARVGGLLLFAASIRPLLACPRLSGTLAADVADEVLLTGHPVFGDQTPVAGIREVLPGHVAEVGEDGAVSQRWHWPGALRSPTGQPHVLAAEFRAALRSAVIRAVGNTRPVAIALSGGIDSSAIAAAAVEAFGADAIRTYTYEFEDPTHVAPETEYARKVNAALGIRHHEVFPIRYQDFLHAIPEHVWRSESAVHWPKAFLLQVSRHLASRGHPLYLSGFGIGSHMQYLSEVGRVLPYLPLKSLTLKYWRRVRFDAWDWLGALARVHPGLEPPHPRLYDLLLQVLERRGMIKDHRRFYPAGMRALLERRRGGLPAWTELDETRPLGEVLQRQAFAHLISCVDVTRSEKASREVGACRISPAHFAECLPYAYFPIDPPPPVYSAARRMRPGKYLLKLAYRGMLPDAVLDRVKSWDDAVSSRAWRKRGRVFMLRALPRFPSDLDDVLGPGHAHAVEQWEPTAIQANCLAFRFWQRLFLDGIPGTTPPQWQDLWGYSMDDLGGD